MILVVVAKLVAFGVAVKVVVMVRPGWWCPMVMVRSRSWFFFVDLTPKKHHPSPYRMNYTEWNLG